MFKAGSTRDANPGDVIHCGDKRLVVIDNNDSGLACIYYYNGIGPHHVVLPHASTHQRQYEDERIGSRESWWNYHPDMTGEYREF